MKALYDLPAPAKLNLFLHIVGRRSDGFHLLQSAFMLIDWYDTLYLQLRSDGHISREDLSLTLPEDDLCKRAALALQKASGCTQGVHIGIHKRIPSQAGMGGGSSDAATVLLGLNRLWGLHWPLSKLQHIGLQLGADVPFFLQGHNAWVQGIGEQITPLQLPAARFVVLKPPSGVSTPAIFAAPTLKRDSEPAIISGFAENPYGFGRNDLQPVAQEMNSEVRQAIHHLQSQGLRPRMTGSGSAVFAPISGDEAVQAPPGGAQIGEWQQSVCSNLSVHPLWGWAVKD
jgi:4-diphosphocytidyl-2-C-methyl-D-erythritol kinase